MSCDNCRQQEIEIRVKMLEDEVSTIKSKQVFMSEAQIETKVKLDTLITTMNQLVTDVKQLATLPAARWNNLVTTLISSSLLGLIGFLAGKLLK